MLCCPECSLLFSGTRWVLTLSDDLYLYLMNNFINFSRKAARDTLERRVVSASSKNIPNIEQYVSRYRYPLIPKIVVYSASSSSDSLLSKAFPFFSFVTPSLTAETDEIITRRIADQLTQASEAEFTQEERSKFGFLIKGFPFNTNQALLFDRYLNGVNLALHIRTQEESPDYLSSIKPLLNYYNQRGTLLELNPSTEITTSELVNLWDEVRINIKRSN